MHTSSSRLRNFYQNKQVNLSGTSELETDADTGVAVGWLILTATNQEKLYTVYEQIPKHSLTLLLYHWDEKGHRMAASQGGNELAYVKKELSWRSYTGASLKEPSSSTIDGSRVYSLAILTRLVILEIWDGVSHRVAFGQAYLVA